MGQTLFLPLQTHPPRAGEPQVDTQEVFEQRRSEIAAEPRRQQAQQEAEAREKTRFPHD